MALQPRRQPSSYSPPENLKSHYLVVVNLREKLMVSKQAAQKFDMQGFCLRKLNDVKVKEQYQVKISDRFAALENLDDSVDIVGDC
jgi:hypothetical protein